MSRAIILLSDLTRTYGLHSTQVLDKRDRVTIMTKSWSGILWVTSGNDYTAAVDKLAGHLGEFCRPVDGFARRAA